jgi:alkanesulfonate monooxygenase SsuD/methylene tetrahydromethanopterin reductase-like flavin-dependent oxidoreductase (luciferase family)
MWSASAAAQLGLPYAFAHFIDPMPTRLAIEHYRSHFQPGSNGPSQPRTILAVGALCADTAEEAERLISSARLFRRRIRSGELGPIPTPEQALRELGKGSTMAGDSSQHFARSFAGEGHGEGSEFPRYAVGTPHSVRDQLIDMASVVHADELMIVTVMHGHRERKYSYELLAEAFGLKPR